MQPRVRAYRDENDYWRIRQFLREVYILNGRREMSWPLYRLDYWRWHVNMNMKHMPLSESIFIWETDDGRMAAVLNPEGQGEAHLQIHPALATPEVEEEMLDVAEEHLAAHANGKRTLRVYAQRDNTRRRSLLKRRGYMQCDHPEHQRRRSMDLAIPDAPIAPGYSLRALGDDSELPARCFASGRAFHPNDMSFAINNRDDVSWYRNIQNAPLYRRDLDIVAVAPDGVIASFCTIWFDDVTRSGGFEPVGTAPEHQQRGLGKAVMCEGLRRLKRMGATQATVGSYSTPAHALYASVGFTEYDLMDEWVRSV